MKKEIDRSTDLPGPQVGLFNNFKNPLLIYHFAFFLKKGGFPGLAINNCFYFAVSLADEIFLTV